MIRLVYDYDRSIKRWKKNVLIKLPTCVWIGSLCTLAYLGMWHNVSVSFSYAHKREVNRAEEKRDKNLQTQTVREKELT